MDTLEWEKTSIQDLSLNMYPKATPHSVDILLERVYRTCDRPWCWYDLMCMSSVWDMCVAASLSSLLLLQIVVAICF